MDTHSRYSISTLKTIYLSFQTCSAPVCLSWVDDGRVGSPWLQPRPSPVALGVWPESDSAELYHFTGIKQSQLPSDSSSIKAI